MPLIKPSKEYLSNTTFIAPIDTFILKKIQSYCSWAGIYDLDYFFEKAARQMILTDQEYQNHV